MESLAEARPRASYLADILKALAHPARLRIVAALCEGEECVIGLAGRLGLPQAVVSQQLRILRMSGLVAAERNRGFARYRLARPRLRQLVACLEGCHSETAGAPRARKKEREDERRR
jgi:ArsR family transcriptional regulator